MARDKSRGNFFWSINAWASSNFCFLTLCIRSPSVINEVTFPMKYATTHVPESTTRVATQCSSILPGVAVMSPYPVVNSWSHWDRVNVQRHSDSKMANIRVSNESTHRHSDRERGRERTNSNTDFNCDHGPIPWVCVFGEGIDVVDGRSVRARFGKHLIEPRIGGLRHRGIAHKEPNAGRQVSA